MYASQIAQEKSGLSAGVRDVSVDPRERKAHRQDTGQVFHFVATIARKVQLKEGGQRPQHHELESEQKVLMSDASPTGRVIRAGNLCSDLTPGQALRTDADLSGQDVDHLAHALTGRIHRRRERRCRSARAAGVIVIMAWATRVRVVLPTAAMASGNPRKMGKECSVSSLSAKISIPVANRCRPTRRAADPCNELDGCRFHGSQACTPTVASNGRFNWSTQSIADDVAPKLPLDPETPVLHPADGQRRVDSVGEPAIRSKYT